MTDKQNFEKDINVPHKEQIIIDGVDVSGCDELWLNFEKNYDSKCIRFKDVYSQCSYCKDNPNCEYKQLQKEKFENLNNRQIVESAENLIYENSELIKNLEEKKQECEELKTQISKIKEYVRHNMFDVERENWFEIFIYTFEDWKKSILENENKYKQECDKYENVLDSIYQYIKTCICEYCISKKDVCVGCYHQDFLDIINKAKEK